MAAATQDEVTRARFLALGMVPVVDTPEEFRRIVDELFEETDLLLTQEFLPTQFDWRVGVLAGEPLFVCQYRMARGHWQIVKHRPDGSSHEGGFRTFELDKAPPELKPSLKNQAMRFPAPGGGTGAPPPR